MNAGQSLHAVERTLPVLDRLRTRKAGAAHVGAGEKQAIGRESGVDGLDVSQTAHEESGGDEQCQRRAELHDDERVAPGGPAGACPAGGAEDRIELLTRGTPRRCESKGERRDRGRERRE